MTASPSASLTVRIDHKMGRLPNKEMKLTKPGQIVASQLISGVGRAYRR